MTLSIPPPPHLWPREIGLNTFLPVQQQRRNAELNFYFIVWLQFSLTWIVRQNYLIDYLIGREKFPYSAVSNGRTTHGCSNRLLRTNTHEATHWTGRRTRGSKNAYEARMRTGTTTKLTIKCPMSYEIGISFKVSFVSNTHTFYHVSQFFLPK